MRISVFGLGYVGCVSSACFSDSGHEVIGVDTNGLKVQIINEGRSPVVEPVELAIGEPGPVDGPFEVRHVMGHGVDDTTGPREE